MEGRDEGRGEGGEGGRVRGEEGRRVGGEVRVREFIYINLHCNTKYREQV